MGFKCICLYAGSGGGNGENLPYTMAYHGLPSIYHRDLHGGDKQPSLRENNRAVAWNPGSDKRWHSWKTVCDVSPSGSPASQGATRPGNSSGPRIAPSERDCSPPSDAGTAEKTRSSSRWPPPLDASTTIEEEVAAALEAKRLDRPGLTIFTDGSRLENGATGYAVTWKKCLTWKGHKAHMGWGQEPTMQTTPYTR